MKQLIEIKKKFWLFLVLILSFSACDDDENVTLPEIVASFVAETVNQETGTVTFKNLSENANSYVWDFGDSTTSTEINPIKTYPTGSYIVTLTASNVAGATATFQDEIRINIPLEVTLPITFDEDNVAYDDVVAFNGAALAVVDNPDLSGTNDQASKVGQITNSGAAFEGFFYNLGTPIDLSSQMTITMNFWSDAPIGLLLKLEEGSAAPTETTANHGGTGWEELIFTFTSAESYERFTFFVDGPGTTSGAFYIDDITQVNTIDLTPPVITLLGDPMINLFVGDGFTDPGATAVDNIDGDISANIVVGGDMVNTAAEGTYTITYNVSDAAGNAAAQVTRVVAVSNRPTAPPVSAPVPPARDAADVISIYGESYTNIGGINYDPNWGQSGHMQVNDAYDPGDGNLALAYLNFNYQGTDFAGNLQNASSMEFIHIDMWTHNADVVQFTPINGSGTPNEVLISLTPINIGEWNSYDIPVTAFTDAGMSLNEIIQLKFDAQAGTTPVDIYLDNIYFYKSPGGGGGCPSGNYTAALAFPVDFEDCETFPTDLNFGTIGTGVVENPFQTGINTSGNVLRVDKPMDAEFWAGFQNNFDGPFDLTATPTFKVKVYSTKPNVVFRFEIAQDDPMIGNPAPVFRTVTNADEWTELSFDFPNSPSPMSYFRLVVKPDNDMNDSPITSDGTYYMDDFRLE